MTFEVVEPEGIATPIAPYSPVVVSNGLVILSGQIPFDEKGKLVSDDFAAQARQVFENVGLSLRAAGCGYEHVIKVTTFLASFDHFAAYNRIYADYFQPPYPARTTVQAGLHSFQIEVDILAQQPPH